MTDPVAVGYLTVHPCGQAMATASNVNFTPGIAVANHVTAELGADGGVCFVSSTKAHVIIDLSGIYLGSG